MSAPVPLDLFPPLAPYTDGMLRVDDIHTLYWEESGNPSGVPVVFLHGGPGAGSSPMHRRFFDPDFWRIIIFDQRGAGRSTPLYETRNNTTGHLVDDLETLRLHRGIDRWHVFGGSWGSTLALAYAQTHPRSCISLILRGLFLMTADEIDWFFYGMRRFFPEAWDAFASFVPEQNRADLLEAYRAIFMGTDGPRKTEAMARWQAYETACSSLLPPPVVAADPCAPPTALPIMEAHYMSQNRFTPDDALLRGVDRIRAIPTTLVHGRYDMLCPVEHAHRLSVLWPEMDLHIIPDAGHAAMEPGIRSALVAATERHKNYV